MARRRPQRAKPEASTAKTPLNPAALSVADAAALFSKASGESITPGILLIDRNAGAPANADGTINLLHYTAWLIRESAHGA